ncbi:MAG: hypothetical protein H7288_11565 [Kineosporiaceae bacterium]|nr:hypothetical protein [Aeromicrobium sp.]
MTARLETHGEQKNRRPRWITEDPHPEYSRLDRLDGLPRCHDTHVIEVDDLPEDGWTPILVSLALSGIAVIVLLGWVLSVVLR